jgi:hypothetical protein
MQSVSNLHISWQQSNVDEFVESFDHFTHFTIEHQWAKVRARGKEEKLIGND